VETLTLLATLWRRGTGHFSRRRVNAAGGSDAGRVRANNEDCFVMADLTEPARTVWSGDGPATLSSPRAFFVVADGMGGAAGGEVGSAMAASIICSQVQGAARDDRLRTAWQWRKTLVDAFETANRRIRDRGRDDPALHGMGTTATAVALARDVLYLAHVGDSRAYLVREGHAKRLTTDHTWLQYVRDSGRPDDLEADDPRRHALLRALGTGADVRVDFVHAGVQPHDTVILCTDGLWSTVGDDELARLLATHGDPAVVCDTLLGLANERGGPDNVTVLVARVGD
jgi:PPM family protein phosphatase